MAVRKAPGNNAARLNRKRRLFAEDSLPRSETLSPEEAWGLYDSQAKKFLGISAEEFARAWNHGEFRARQEDPNVRRVIMIRTKKPSA